MTSDSPQQLDEALALRSLLSSSPDLVYFLDREGRYQYVSEEGARALGLTSAAMIGRTWCEVGLPQERENEFAVERAEVLARATTIRREVRLEIAGEERVFDSSVSPVFDRDGNAASVMAVSRDITEQSRVTLRLRQSYRDLADAMPQIVWTAAGDGTIDYYNRRWYDYAGLPPESGSAAEWSLLLHPDDRKQTHDRWHHSLQTGEPYDIQHRFLDRLTGHYRWFLTRALAIRNEEGTVVRWFGTATDIDDQKRALEELQRREERLVKTNAVIHTVGQLSQRLSAELNLERLAQTVTDAATQLTGAQFGVFFYNGGDASSEEYTLFAISGVPRAAFERFTMPRDPEVFAATFHEGATHRSDDIRTDSGVAGNDVVGVMLGRHLTVTSYLAVPVVSRSGEIMGALIFGHAASGIFTAESEQIAAGLASQAAIAIDNARLFETAGRSTAEIRRGGERYRTLATATAQIVWSAAPSGAVVSDSPSWRSVTGQRVEELLGRGWLDAVHPADQVRVWSAWSDSIANSVSFETEYRLRTRDGSHRWFATRAYPVRDPDGTIREWIGAASDIDDKRRSDEAAAFLAEAATLLSSSLAYEATLRSLANLVVPRLADCCAIDMVAEHGAYERVAVAHVDPAREGSFLDAGRKRAAPSPLHDPIAAVLASGEPLLLDGSPVLAAGEHPDLAIETGAHSMLIVPMIARGRTLGSISLLYTTSDRRYSRSDLPFLRDLARSAAVAVDNARLYTEAETANRAKDEFLATLSHELRTPMTAVLGWAQLLRIGGLDESMFQEAVETIERSSQIQAQLIDDILDVSRISAGKLHLDVGPVDLPAVIDAALDTVRQASRGKGIALVADLDRTFHDLQGDPNRLQQVFWNLLSNAVKFTAGGGQIRVTLDHVDSSARITVSDNGRGIASDFVPHVFEQFRQADSSTTRIFGGLGLGLTIVRQIVELHGGSVTAASEGLDRGATFTVLLPLVSATAEDGADNDLSDSPLPDLHGLQVLLVEDDEANQRLISSVLTRAGASVRVETSAQNALDGLRREIPDILVSDLTIPDGDGLSLIGRIRKELAIGEDRMPAVALTSFGRLDDRMRILGAGFQNYVVKPVDPADLTTIVRITAGR